MLIYFILAFGRVHSERVVVFVSNHSQDVRGDLYLGPNLTAPVNDVGTQICCYLQSYLTWLSFR